MDVDDTKNIYDSAINAYVFAQAHFSYYAGVIVAMLTDNDKYDLKTWLKNAIINIVLVTASIEVLKSYQYSKGAIILLCTCVAIMGYPAIKQFSRETMPRLMDLLGDSLVRIGNAITDKIIDWIGKK